ncbi:MAG: MFS transporter [bacterium]
MKINHLRFSLRRDRPLGTIYVLSFLTSLGVAVIQPFLALYFETFVPLSFVGLLLSISYLISILANIFGARIIRLLHEQRVVIIALGGTALMLFLLGFVGHVAILIVIFSLYTFFITLIWFNIQLYIKHNSATDKLSGNEGKLGSIINLGFVLAPFIGGAIASRYDLPAVFIASAIFTLLGLILFAEIRPYDHEEIAVPGSHFLQQIKNYFRDPELTKIYLTSFGLYFNYSLWIFLPVYLLELGMSLASLGLLYSLTALPWVILEYPIGRLADKKSSLKGFLVAGFFLLAIVSFTFGILNELSWIIAALVVGVIGSSFIEMNSFSAFFKLAGHDNVERLSIFRTAMGLGQISGPLVAALILAQGSLSFLFIFAGFVGLLLLANALSLKKI